jgi:hypothetical protein
VRWIAAAALSLFPLAAFAGPVSPNIGVLEVVAEPGGDHLGVYPYAAASMLFPVGKFAIIPAVGVEWAPEFDRWGFTGTVTADYAIGSRVGLDLNLAFIHDQQDHHWDDAIFLAGGGPGVSIFLGKLTVSPYVSYFHGLNVEGGAIVPGLNLALAL